MSKGEQVHKVLGMARILQIAFLVAVLIYIVVVLPPIGIVPLYVMANDDLTILTSLLGPFAALCLLLGYFLPRWTFRRKCEPKRKETMLAVHIFRIALFESVAIYGLLLGTLGAALQVILPFFFVSAILLIVTFPTKEKWKRWLS